MLNYHHTDNQERYVPQATAIAVPMLVLLAVENIKLEIPDAICKKGEKKEKRIYFDNVTIAANAIKDHIVLKLI